MYIFRSCLEEDSKKGVWVSHSFQLLIKADKRVNIWMSIKIERYSSSSSGVYWTVCQCDSCLISAFSVGLQLNGSLTSAG